MAEQFNIIKDLYRMADEDELEGVSLRKLRKAIREEAAKPDKITQTLSGEPNYEQGPSALREVCADIWYDVICSPEPFDDRKDRAAQVVQLFYEEDCGYQDVDVNQCLEAMANYFHQGEHRLDSAFDLMNTMVYKLETPTQCPTQTLYNLDTLDRWWQESGEPEYNGQTIRLANLLWHRHLRNPRTSRHYLIEQSATDAKIPPVVIQHKRPPVHISSKERDDR